MMKYFDNYSSMIGKDEREEWNKGPGSSPGGWKDYF
jgi:hypothetical protein